MLDFKGLLHHLSEKLTAAGVRFALIGGLAMHAAGLNRATGDVDLLVDAEDAAAFKATMLSMGYKIIFENDNVLHFASPWVLTGGVDVILARHKYSQDMIKHAVLAGNGMPVVAPEGIVGLKVQAINNNDSRYTQDMADIEWLIRTHFKTMDMKLVREYFELFAMAPELDKLLQRVQHAE